MLRLTQRLGALRAMAPGAAHNSALPLHCAPAAYSTLSSAASSLRSSLALSSFRGSAALLSRCMATKGGDAPAGGDEDDGGGESFDSSAARMPDDEKGEREKPSPGTVLGRASKADRAALKAKQRRQSRATAEEQKHARAKQEKERTRAIRAAARTSQEAAVGDGPEDAEASAEARKQARELGLLEEAADEETNSRPPVAAAAAPAASSSAPAAAAGGKGKKKEDSALDLAVKAAAALTAGGKKASPAAVAAANVEVARLRALAAAEASVVRLNDKITASQIILIGTDGKKVPGVLTRAEALAQAREARMDLLQISPAHLVGQPAVCKMLDYRRFKSDQSRRERDTKRSARLLQREPKTMQLKSKIASGDLLVKIGRMRAFLAKHHPVRLIYISKNPDPLIFFPLLQTCVEKLVLDGYIEEGSLTPDKHYVNFSPMNDKKRQTIYPRLTEAQRKEFGVTIDEHGVWKEKGRIPEGEKQDNDEDDVDDEEDEDDAEEDEDAAATPAKPAATPAAATAAAAPKPAATAAAATPAAAASAATSKVDDDVDDDEDDLDEDEDEDEFSGGGGGKKGGKRNKKQKKAPSYLTAPPLFSKAAIQAKLHAAGARRGR